MAVALCNQSLPDTAFSKSLWKAIVVWISPNIGFSAAGDGGTTDAKDGGAA